MQEQVPQPTKHEKIIAILQQYRLVFVIIGFFACILALYGIYNQKAHGLYEQNERERATVEKLTVPAWERKVDQPGQLRLGLMGDLRIQLENNYTFASDIEDRYTAVSDYMKPLAFFRSQMQSFQPHYIATLGNIIQGDDQDSTAGAEAVQFVRRQLEKVNAPTLWVIGNRDLRSLTRTQFQELTDAPAAPYTIIHDGYKIIVLDTNYNDEGEAYDAVSDVSEHKRGAFPRNQMNWLKEELDTSKQVIVLMHHGAFGKTLQIGNKKEKSISDVDELRETFARYNVAAVISGHLNGHAYQVSDGVTYYSLRSIKDTGKNLPGAFYELTVDDRISKVTLHYIDDSGEHLVSEPFKDKAQKIGIE